MPIIEGRYVADTKAEIVAEMMDVLQSQFDRKINPDDVGVFFEFMSVYAEVLAIFQAEMRAVLDSAHLQHAEGKALDYLVELKNVKRRPARRASGEQEFYLESARGRDIFIPEGATVQTNGDLPIRFRTTESGTLDAGDLSIFLDIEAVEPGVKGNVGADNINTFSTSNLASELKTMNRDPVTGGRDREEDDELRERAAESVGDDAKATLPALLHNLRSLKHLESATLYWNDTDTDGGAGYNLPSQTIEPIISYNDDDWQPVWDALAETKAACEPTVGGVNGTERTGTAELDNKQEITLRASEATEVDIHIEITVDVIEDEFVGTKKMKDNIVDYIGGHHTNGEYEKHGLTAGDDVIHGDVEYESRVPGIYDYQEVLVGKSDPPSGTSNISITPAEVPTTDARPTTSQITINTNYVER